MGSGKTYLELELEWSGDYQRAEPDVGIGAGWDNVTLETVKFDVSVPNWTSAGVKWTKQTIELKLTDEQRSLLEFHFADDASQELEA